MSDLQAYCLKCKEKVSVQNAEETTSASGALGIIGTCPQCGRRVYKPISGPKRSASTGKKSSNKKSSAKKTQTARKGKLVIVESPTKARTIQRYLGQEYSVKASIGHVRDLLRSRLSVDLENDFTPEYRVPNDKREVVKELQQAVSRAKEVYLATDPDREGEAIAWHIMAATQMDEERARRVVFHEITRDAIQRAFAHPRDIDMHLVDAQQARRILDRLVGYQLSPLLWKKVRSRLSAGRVQSVAVRLIVEREREIDAFEPEEYWTLDSLLAPHDGEGETDRFKARLTRVDGEEPSLPDETTTQRICADLEGAEFRVREVRRGTRRRSPSPPFTTSTLQQDASRVLRFQASRTMRVAQQLYEGVELGSDDGSTGLITYMRTDSVHVARTAIEDTRSFVLSQFSDKYLPEKPRHYRTKSKMAQEAHEAIRPTSILRTPEKVKPYLTRDQYALYRLIWRRMVASQMSPALYDTISVDVAAKGTETGREYLFRASGSNLKFPGFLKVYGAQVKETAEEELPPLQENELLKLLELLPEQHFTQPPPRYNEASLIREMESEGIGRPSTYASIISTIINRGYVERQDRNLVPTETAYVVNDLLVENFPNVIDIGFTAQLEDALDEIATGEKAWVPVVSDFYGPFSEALDKADKTIKAVRMEDEPAGINCDVCGAEMVVKYGRFGKFIGCSRYPDCKNTKPFVIKTGAKCPQCGSDLVQKRSRKGRVFYGCEGYPECDFATYSRPLATPCPSCGSLLVQKGRDRAACTACGKAVPLASVEEQAEELAQGK